MPAEVVEPPPKEKAFDANQHLILDHPLLRVPHELARKGFKSAQRDIERARDETLSALKKPSSKPLETLDAQIARLETLKRKLTTLHSEEQTLHKATRARIDHLNDLHSVTSASDALYEDWSKIRLNRLVVDYLLRTGYEETAKRLAHSSGIEDLVDLDAFVQCERIRGNLREGKMKEALQWCGDNRSALKAKKNELEYELRLQQYIELIRVGGIAKLLEARAHAIKYLTSHPDPEFAIRAAGLLPFRPDTPAEPYRTLFSKDRYRTLSDMFITTYQQLLSLPGQPALYSALSAGLSALKTPACHSSNISPSVTNTAVTNTAVNESFSAGEQGSKNKSKPLLANSGGSVCPICSTELHELARNVPYAHHSKSDVESDPVVLPNGRVYGRQRLQRFQENFGGEDLGPGALRDPSEPGSTFLWSDVKKVYIS